MGLLDDAIREHLELKRKHGANPEDVARQEQEALGPGQRNEFAQPEGGRGGAEPGAATSAAAVAPEASAAGVRATAAPVDELPEGEPGIPEEPPAAQAPGYDEDPWLDDEPDEVPADEALQERPRRPRRRRRGRGRARGDARLPPGDARARPPVVRAEAAARLRLGQVVAQVSPGRADDRGASSPD